jgi:hypothetical protein
MPAVLDWLPLLNGKTSALPRCAAYGGIYRIKDRAVLDFDGDTARRKLL